MIVSHYNSARTIGRCITRLLNQDYPNELTRIIIVDAGSTDGSTEIVSQFDAPNVMQFVVQGSTEAEGQIFGVQSSDSEVIMFTNSDIYVPHTWISEHVERLLSGYDLVGGKVFWGGDKYALTWNMPKPENPRFVQEPGLGLGFSNCSTTRELFTRVGGLKRLRSQHDTEFAFRVVHQGGKMILDPAIEVFHDHPLKSFRASFIRSLGYAMNHVLVMRAAYGRIVTGSGTPTMMPLSTLIREWTCLNGIKTYKEHRAVALAMGIQVSLLEFLFIRLFSTKLGQMVGVFVGATKRNVAYESVINLHNDAKKEKPRSDLGLPSLSSMQTRGGRDAG